MLQLFSRNHGFCFGKKSIDQRQSVNSRLSANNRALVHLLGKNSGSGYMKVIDTTTSLSKL